MTYAVCLYALRRGHWRIERVVESHTDLPTARAAVKRLQETLPHGGITRSYGVATIDL